MPTLTAPDAPPEVEPDEEEAPALPAVPAPQTVTAPAIAE
ncbi:hypothetical protein LT85_2757 [Collimonas arenae]|uniref:Uncharacterized protein n=1 Tax=Collimonas arenae TaxID=279058 RepID=A0A0A1FDP4_9BURK|nr:hypothetical protein LT85_2757 [Collimonas arenae]